MYEKQPFFDLRAVFHCGYSLMEYRYAVEVQRALPRVSSVLLEVIVPVRVIVSMAIVLFIVLL